MPKRRYFIIPRQQRWTIHCSRRRIGAFGDPADAVFTALEVASIQTVRGHLVEVLHQDAHGRWLSVAAERARIEGLLGAPVRPVP